MSLVLLDELGSGTDPNEAVSLAKAIIDYCLRKGSFSVNNSLFRIENIRLSITAN